MADIHSPEQRSSSMKGDQGQRHKRRERSQEHCALVGLPLSALPRRFSLKAAARADATAFVHRTQFNTRMGE